MFSKKTSNEYSESSITISESFEDFKNSVTKMSINFVSASFFGDLDTSGFVYEAIDFVRSRPDTTIHVFRFMEKDEAGLGCGLLSREKNVVHRMIYRGYNRQ
jgi:hypothetical protein